MSPEPSTRAAGEPHWLVRPATIRRLWVALIVLLVLSVAAGLGVHPHPVFGFEDSFGFFALYGFAVCVAMVGVAKVLGWVLKRPDSYYDRPDTSPGADSPANLPANASGQGRSEANS